MRLSILCSGNFKNSALSAYENELLKRLNSSLFKIALKEIKPPRSVLQPAMLMKAEGEKFLTELKPGHQLIALDEGGKELTSPQFANWMQQQMNTGCRGLTFVIGGAYGLDSQVLEHANLKLSLSKMTFPYQLARLVLVEQLYRVASILAGSSYHKE